MADDAEPDLADWEKIAILQADKARLEREVETVAKAWEYWVNEARAETAGLRLYIEAAEKLHAPRRMYPEFRFGPWCGECSTGIRTFGDDGPSDHIVHWPCATAKALGMVDPLAPTDAS